MKRKLHLITSLMIVISMLASNVAFASNNATEAGSTATSEVELTMEVAQFDATVPTGLIVAVQADGSTITATEANIVNNSHAPIYVSDVTVTPYNGYSLVDFDSEFYKMPVGKKVFGFQLNTENVTTAGKVALARSNWPVMYGYESLELDYDAGLPAIRDKDTGYKKMADVTFTLDFWSSDSSSSNEGTVTPDDDEPIDITGENLTAAQASLLWEWTNDEATQEVTLTKYIGPTETTTDIVVPASIDGNSTVAMADETIDIPHSGVNSLTIPSGISLQSGSIIDDAIMDGTLTNLYIDSDIPDNAFQSIDITNIVFGKNVDSIGESAFGGISGSGGITLSIKSIKGLENVSTIGDYAFAHATGTSFEEIGSIDGGNIKIKDGATVGLCAFTDCTFDNVTIGKNVTLDDYVFNRSKIKGTLNIGDGASIGTTGLGIYGADRVNIGKDITLTGTTFTRTSSGGMYYAPEIVNLFIDSDVPDNFLILRNGNSVSTGNGCKVTNLTFGSNCTSIGEMAFSLDNIAGYQIESITGLENVKSIGSNAFTTSANYSPTDYSVIADSVSLTLADDVVVGEYAFGYSNLGNVDIGANASLGSYSFYSSTCKSINLGTGVNIGGNAFGLANITNVKAVSNTTFNDCAFYKATLGELNTGINAILGEKVFSKVGKLTLNKGSMFDDNAFSYLTVTTLVVDCDIPDRTFDGRMNYISNIEFTSNCTSIGEYAFYNDSSVDNGIQSLKGLENVKSIGMCAFALGTSSSTIASGVPISIGDNATVAARAFNKLSNSNVNIGKNVTLNEDAFRMSYIAKLTVNGNLGSVAINCYGITDLYIADTVTAVDSDTFSSISITNVSLPSTLANISSYFGSATVTVR